MYGVASMDVTSPLACHGEEGGEEQCGQILALSERPSVVTMSRAGGEGGGGEEESGQAGAR